MICSLAACLLLDPDAGVVAPGEEIKLGKAKSKTELWSQL